MSVIIRKEKPGDIKRIYEVTTSAFSQAPHTDHTEQYIVNSLRDAGALSISLVAEIKEMIVGHVALSPVAINNRIDGWFGLGPISVIPSEHGKGIGSKLVHAALAELKNLNASGCVLLGDPNYYHRFGFATLDGLVLQGVPPKYFQGVVLQGSHPKGTVTYHESFTAQE